MKYVIREFSDSESDREAVISIFNYFVRESFAAYTDKEIDYDFIKTMRHAAIAFYVLEVEGKIAGFGVLRPYLPYDTFKHSATLTYFMLPEYTGKGLGSELLQQLEEAGRTKKITQLFAHISSKNYQSLRFHKKHGFYECGRLTGIGIKFNEPFDVVWVQKTLR